MIWLIATDDNYEQAQMRAGGSGWDGIAAHQSEAATNYGTSVNDSWTLFGCQKALKPNQRRDNTGKGNGLWWPPSKSSANETLTALSFRFAGEKTMTVGPVNACRARKKPFGSPTRRGGVAQLKLLWPVPSSRPEKKSISAKLARRSEPFRVETIAKVSKGPHFDWE